jgi:hypothetical protein
MHFVLIKVIYWYKELIFIIFSYKGKMGDILEILGPPGYAVS